MKIITDQQITDAAMELVIEKGYCCMTTKDIAERAGVHEATLFRRLGSKKEIVLRGLADGRWLPCLEEALFEDAAWDLAADLERFMLAYYRRVTPRVVQMSIGLRAPQVYEETAAYIRRVPESFVQALEGYFEAMQHKGKIGRAQSPHALAMTVFSATFGFIFLKASFEDALTPLDQEAFIRASVAVFAKGIQ